MNFTYNGKESHTFSVRRFQASWGPEESTHITLVLLSITARSLSVYDVALPKSRAATCTANVNLWKKGETNVFQSKNTPFQVFQSLWEPEQMINTFVLA